MADTRKIELTGYTYLSDAQWDRISHFFPEPADHPHGGRPFHSSRACLEGSSYVLITGCQWSRLPKAFPRPAPAGGDSTNGHEWGFSMDSGSSS